MEKKRQGKIETKKHNVFPHLETELTNFHKLYPAMCQYKPSNQWKEFKEQSLGG